MDFEEYLEESKKIIGDQQFYVINNMEQFLNKITYEDGMPCKTFMKNEKDDVTIVYRDKETGVVKKIVNGKDVTQTNQKPILIKHRDMSKEELNIIGKVVSLEEWDKHADSMMKNVYEENRFVASERIEREMKIFRETLNDYRKCKGNFYFTEEQMDYGMMLTSREDECLDRQKEQNAVNMFDNVKASILQSDIGEKELQNWMQKIAEAERGDEESEQSK